MASIGVLVKAIAEVSTLEEGTVALVARYAREAGFISQGTRGPGAARMTERDAANLLIALQGALLAKDAAKTIAQYRELTAEYDELSDDLPCPGFLRRALQVGITFGLCLEQVIAGFMSDGSNPSEWDLFTKDERHDEFGTESRLSVRTARPVTKASIYFTNEQRSDGLGLSFSPSDRKKPKAVERDWTTESWFTDVTLKVVGKVLST